MRFPNRAAGGNIGASGGAIRTGGCVLRLPRVMIEHRE